MIPIQFRVAVQGKDGGPWTPGTISYNSHSDHYGRSYKIRIMKTRRLVKRTSRCENNTHIIEAISQRPYG